MCSVAQLSWTLFAAPLTLVCQSQIWIVWISQARILEWLLLPIPGDLPDNGIKHSSLASPALAGRFFTTTQCGSPWII